MRPTTTLEFTLPVFFFKTERRRLLTFVGARQVRLERLRAANDYEGEGWGEQDRWGAVHGFLKGAL